MATGNWQLANGKWKLELVHGIWNFASGCLGIKHCLAGICVCSFRVSLLQGSVDGILDFTSGHPGSTHCSALMRVCSFRSIHVGVWFMGFRILPLGIWGSTLPGIEVRMHCQLNSIWDRFKGFGSYLWVSGKKTLLCIEMHTQLGLKCICSFSGQPSAAHSGRRFLVFGLDQVRTARLSRGSQITSRHPRDHSMLSYPITYAVGSCTWFNSGVDQVRTARPSCGVQIATRHPV